MSTSGAKFTPNDGPTLNVDDAGGDGLPVIFQHGLCGDARQTTEAFPVDPRFRRITLESRGQGASEPGDLEHLSISTFATDTAEFIERNGVAPVVVGGISMGAAIALRLAVRRPDLVRGLIIARPAWVTDAAPANMRPNSEVGALLAEHPGDVAQRMFVDTATAAALGRDAPDNLASLTAFFSRHPRNVTAALLTSIAGDGPGVSEAEVRSLRIPTLVIGHERDSIHPIAHARAIAEMIPNSSFVEITPKVVDRARYVSDFHSALSNFLKACL